MTSLDRFSQDTAPAYPPEWYVEEKREDNMAMKAVKAIEAARMAVGELVNYLNIHIDKDNIKVLVNDLRDLEQIPAKLSVSFHNGGEDCPFSHKAEKELDGVKFFTYLYKKNAI